LAWWRYLFRYVKLTPQLPLERTQGRAIQYRNAVLPVTRYSSRYKSMFVADACAPSGSSTGSTYRSASIFLTVESPSLYKRIVSALVSETNKLWAIDGQWRSCRIRESPTGNFRIMESECHPWRLCNCFWAFAYKLFTRLALVYINRRHWTGERQARQSLSSCRLSLIAERVGVVPSDTGTGL
jgi:hypothetical protein